MGIPGSLPRARRGQARPVGARLSPREPRLSAALRIHRRKRSHRDFHGLMNNVLSFSLSSSKVSTIQFVLGSLFFHNVYKGRLPSRWATTRVKGFSTHIQFLGRGQSGLYGRMSSRRCVSLRVLLPIDFTCSCEICWPWLICSRAAWVSSSSTRVTFGARRVVALPVRLYSSSTRVTRRWALAFSAKFITVALTAAA